MFDKDTCKRVWEAIVLMRRIRIGTLYKILGRIDSSIRHHIVDPKIDDISSCIVESTMLWHQRLGHIYEKGLHVVQGKGMVKHFPKCSSKFNLCEHYVNGKQNWVSFPTKSTREKTILELVHTDVFGPISVPSLGESRYYVSFIDDFSRMILLYFLKKKWEEFEKFLKFKSLVENKTKKRIKVMRIDNRGEFYGKEFN